MSQSVECYNRSSTRNYELEALLASKASVRVATPPVPPSHSKIPDDSPSSGTGTDGRLVDTLQLELLGKDKDMQTMRNGYEARVHELNHLLTQERDSCTAMRVELRDRPNQSELVELQHEIGVLKSIVFSVDSPETDSGTGSGSGSNQYQDEKTTLDALLANKVKALEKELTTNRIRIWSLEEEAVSCNCDCYC